MNTPPNHFSLRSRRSMIKTAAVCLGAAVCRPKFLAGQQDGLWNPQLPPKPPFPNIALYTAGRPYISEMMAVLQGVAQSRYDTLILGGSTIFTATEVGFSGFKLVTDGVFNKSLEDYATQVRGLKQAGAISRVELSLAPTSFRVIRSLYAQYQNSPSNPLYKTLTTLKEKLGLDAINYDDEGIYNHSSSVAFAITCLRLGLKITICPYTAQEYWVGLVKSINDAVPGAVDAAYLQCYDGGYGADVAQWNDAFTGTGLLMSPGYWAPHFEPKSSTCTYDGPQHPGNLKDMYWEAAETQAALAALAKTTSLAGAFIYSARDILDCPGGGTLPDYATAMRAGVFGTGL